MKKQKEPQGRKPELTPELEAELLKHIVFGASIRDACLLAGTTVQSVMNWQRKGREKSKHRKELYQKFFERLEEAKAKRRQYYRAEIIKLSKTKNDWRGVAFMATVTDPSEFGQRVHVVVEQELASAIERLKREFENEHQILERALSAIVGEVGTARIADAERSKGIEIDGISTQLDTASAK